MTATAEILLVVVLVLANGLFSGAEIAILSMRKTRVVELAERAGRRGRALLALRDDPERFLATIQVGITVIGSTASAVGGASLREPLTVWLERQGVGRHADDVALAIVVAGISYLTLVLGELVPKSLALRAGERYALLAGLPLRGLAWLARPLVWFLAGSSNLVLRAFHDQTSFTETRVSPDEIHQLVEEATQAGTLHREAGEIATRAVDLADVRVSAAMVPLVDMVCLDADAPPEVIRATLLRTRHRRFPVYEQTLDNILGYVTMVELWESFDRGVRDVRSVLRTAHFVPDTARALDVLKEMQSARHGMALVVREQGTIAGLVTIEDLVEELVGEIVSEYEPEVKRIQTLEDGTILIDGRVGIHELNRELGLELPDGARWTTLAGFAISLHGSLPRPGTRIRVDDHLDLEVVDATSRRVRLLKLHRRRSEPGAQPPEAEA